MTEEGGPVVVLAAVAEGQPYVQLRFHDEDPFQKPRVLTFEPATARELARQIHQSASVAEEKAKQAQTTN